ncbi:MAG: hypothetical protein NE334_14020 [Lentisphaeraceae bacterium]|nr:hypothetical protein [Lentisphaeraceae bacterium]
MEQIFFVRVCVLLLTFSSFLYSEDVDKRDFKRIHTGVYTQNEIHDLILNLINTSKFDRAELYIKNRSIDAPEEDISLLWKALEKAKALQEMPKKVVKKILPKKALGPVYVNDEALDIDGDLKDWEEIGNLLDDVGFKSKNADLIDVGSLKMAYSHTHLYLAINFPNGIAAQSVEGFLDVMQIAFDVDANQNTGCERRKIYFAKIKGFESRLELKLDSVGELIANVNDFAKKTAWDTEGSLEFKDSNLEVKIPLDILGIASAEGKRKVRFLFAESANSKQARGYTKIIYTLVFPEEEE